MPLDTRYFLARIIAFFSCTVGIFNTLRIYYKKAALARLPPLFYTSLANQFFLSTDVKDSAFHLVLYSCGGFNTPMLASGVLIPYAEIIVNRIPFWKRFRQHTPLAAAFEQIEYGTKYFI